MWCWDAAPRLQMARAAVAPAATAMRLEAATATARRGAAVWNGGLSLLGRPALGLGLDLEPQAVTRGRL